MVPQKRGEAGFIDGSGGESQDGLGGFGLRSGERETVHLKKQNPDDKARTLVAIDKWMVLDDAGRIGSSHFDDVLHPFAGGDGGDAVAVPTVVILEAIGSRRTRAHVSTVLVHLSVSYRTNGSLATPLRSG